MQLKIYDMNSGVHFSRFYRLRFFFVEEIISVPNQFLRVSIPGILRKLFETLYRLRYLQSVRRKQKVRYKESRVSENRKVHSM